jgi:hypothetical protein
MTKHQVYWVVCLGPFFKIELGFDPFRFSKLVGLKKLQARDINRSNFLFSS